MTSSETVEYLRRLIPEAQGAVALLTLNRPATLNAINWEMVTAFDAAITRAVADDDIRAILVTGSGTAFSAGGDLKSYVELQQDAERFTRFVSELHAAFARLRSLRVPVIALVNGTTAAGGLELLMSCDIVLAADSARIGDAHLNYGQMGGGGVLTMLPRIVGIPRAAELMFTGRLLSAQEAFEWGLVNHVVPDDDLFAEGMALAGQIASKSPLAIANAKDVMSTIWMQALSVPDGLKLELETNVEYCVTSEDAREGLNAFAEKRKPRFVGK